MKRRRSVTIIFAAIFAAILFVGAGAEAGNLFSLRGDSTPRAAAERQNGLFEQALNWLTGAWTDMTSIFASSETILPPSGAKCDAGIGLDPEGNCLPRP